MASEESMGSKIISTLKYTNVICSRNKMIVFVNSLDIVSNNNQQFNKKMYY